MSSTEGVKNKLFDINHALLKLLLSHTTLTVEQKRNVENSKYYSGLDWDGILLDASSQALGALFFQRLTELNKTNILDADYQRSLELDSLHAQLQCDIQKNDARVISESLSKLGVRHAFLKGLAYREWFYRPAWVRPGSDIDILIDESNIELVREAMKQLGFVQASRNWDFTNFRKATECEIAETEAQHYELAQFAKSYSLNNAPEWVLSSEFRRGPPFTFENISNKPTFNSVVDIHWALHFVFAMESPLDNITNLQLSDEEGGIPVLSREWSLIYTCFKLYYESFDHFKWGVHHLIDIVALLTIEGDINWGVIEELVSYYGLEPALFYTLSAAEKIADKTVPEDLLKKWSNVRIHTDPIKQLPHGGVYLDIDLGDFTPRMMGKRIPTELFKC